jgi:hypothetical protein
LHRGHDVSKIDLSPGRARQLKARHETKRTRRVPCPLPPYLPNPRPPRR